MIDIDDMLDSLVKMEEKNNEILDNIAEYMLGINASLSAIERRLFALEKRETEDIH